MLSFKTRVRSCSETLHRIRLIFPTVTKQRRIEWEGADLPVLLPPCTLSDAPTAGTESQSAPPIISPQKTVCSGGVSSRGSLTDRMVYTHPLGSLPGELEQKLNAIAPQPVRLGVVYCHLHHRLLPSSSSFICVFIIVYCHLRHRLSSSLFISVFVMVYFHLRHCLSSSSFISVFIIIYFLSSFSFISVFIVVYLHHRLFPSSLSFISVFVIIYFCLHYHLFPSSSLFIFIIVYFNLHHRLFSSSSLFIFIIVYFRLRCRYFHLQCCRKFYQCNFFLVESQIGDNKLK